MDASVLQQIAAYMIILAIIELVISGAFFHEAVCSHPGKVRVFNMFVGVCFLLLAFCSALIGFDYAQTYLEYLQ